MNLRKVFKKMPKRLKIELGLFAVALLVFVGVVAANRSSFSSKADTTIGTITSQANATYLLNSVSKTAQSNIASVSKVIITPTAPSNLTATAVSTSQINLAWQDNSTNETGFKVYRGTVSGSTTTLVATLGADIISYSNTGLSSNTTYYYKVQAYNSGGLADSNEASARTLSNLPAAPSNLTAAAVSSSQINLVWQDNSTNETSIRVERSLSSSTGFTQIADLIPDTTTYSNTGLTANTTYYYRVRAYNTYGYSPYSNTAQATTGGGVTLPTAPSGLAAAAVSSSQINLSWTDNSANETGFKIERSLSSTTGFVQIATVGVNITTYSNTGLTAGTTYYYRVRSYNTAGDSAYSNTANAATQPSTDNPPTVSITSPANGSTVSGTVSVTATASDDKGVSKVDFYVDSVFKYSDTASPYSWSWNTTTYTNGSHTLLARAYDTISQFTNSQVTVTVSNSTTPDLIITNVSASTTSSTATINWTTNLAATSQIFYGLTTSYGLSTPLDSNLVTSHSVTITGLSANKRYYYNIVSTTSSDSATYASNFRTKKGTALTTKGGPNK